MHVRESCSEIILTVGGEGTRLESRSIPDPAQGRQVTLRQSPSLTCIVRHQHDLTQDKKQAQVNDDVVPCQMVKSIFAIWCAKDVQGRLGVEQTNKQIPVYASSLQFKSPWQDETSDSSTALKRVCCELLEGS